MLQTSAAPVAPITRPVRLLRLIYSTLIFASSVYLYFFFLQTDFPFYTKIEQAAFASTFFLVVVFSFLMLVFLHKYLPSSIGKLLNLILAPLLIPIINVFLEKADGVVSSLVFGSISYLTSLLLAFILLVLVYPFFHNFQLKSYLKRTLPQFLFIIPAGVTLSIFGQYLFYHQFASTSLLSISYLYFILVILQQTILIARQIKKESVYADK